MSMKIWINFMLLWEDIFGGVRSRDNSTRKRKNYWECWLGTGPTVSELLIVIYRCILWCSKSSFHEFSSLNKNWCCRRSEGKHKTNLHFYDAWTCPCGCFLIIFQESTIILFSDDLWGTKYSQVAWMTERENEETFELRCPIMWNSHSNFTHVTEGGTIFFDISLIFDIVKVKRII